MKNLFLVIVASITLFNCGEGSKNQRILSTSSGNINNLSVVVDNLLWEGNVGDAIRDIVGAPAEGLPQDEPLFSISQLPPQVFSDFTTKSRIILKIEKGRTQPIKIGRDVFARPQTLIIISGKTDDEIIQQLTMNSDKIIDALQKEEIHEIQRRINLSLLDINPIKDKLGINLNISSAYRIAVEKDDFFWVRKETRKGSMDLLFYEVPLNNIRKGDSAVIDIVRMRDSIGKTHIEGVLEDTYMITEEAYAPYIFDTSIDNKPTIETKGVWDLKNGFMSGPFINYAIEDKVNNRYVVVEGYVFAPSVSKRDFMLELESIIRTTTIK